MPAFATRVRVRYAETDRMGVAHHAAYLHWMELARTELMRAAGCTYREFEEQGWQLPVAEAGCRYLVPAKYDDELLLECEVIELKKRLMRIAVRIRRAADGVLLATGFTVHPCLDAVSGGLRAFPETFVRMVAPYLAGSG